ncbi:hypothetical protein [Mesorhizobium sp. SP-1A]|uniref:hypothetical protein n=1 Tax=Mesorhizobium sp. SP-1A TaxID=3077840 RepID=UPI0028F7490A|nr:hypothetical protein [Mesorhizobium sp. SP-1A]
MAKRKSRMQSGPRPESLFSQIVKSAPPPDTSFLGRIYANLTYDGVYHQYAIVDGMRFMVRIVGMKPLNFLANMGLEVEGGHIFHLESGKVRIDVIANHEFIPLLKVGAKLELYDGPMSLRAHGTVTLFDFSPDQPLSNKAYNMD